MKAFLFAAAVAAGLAGFSVSEAEARFPAQGIAAPSLVENAQCVVRRVRTVRPNGRIIIIRTVRNCGRGVTRCRTVRERLTRPNGRVIVRSVRRCR